VLPAEILQFNVQLKNTFSQLTWTSRNEQGLKSYTVERSTDGINFTAAGTIDVKGNTSFAEVQQYGFKDLVPVQGKVYYRLRLTGNEGAVKFSHVLNVQQEQAKLFEINNVVNPINTKLSFHVVTDQPEQLDVQLLDGMGRAVLKQKVSADKGTNAFSIDVPAHLQAGTYLLRVVSKNTVVNKVLQKK
jgi:hypothetical protein